MKKLASGILFDEVAIGTGTEVLKGSDIKIRWQGTLNRGDSFGGGEIQFRAGQRDLITGLSQGVIGMREGGVRRLRVSPHLAYRDSNLVPGIPANAVLNFEVHLLLVLSSPSASQDDQGQTHSA